MDDAELQELVDAELAKPASTSFDGMSVENRGLAELQDVVTQSKATNAASKNHRGIRFTKLVPPGANG